MRYLAGILFFFILTVSAYSANDWHRGIFRVNTDISSGDESIERVAEKANANGMKFVVFSDQFIVIAEYGLPPFRNVFKLKKQRSSIASYGITKYLEEIERVQKIYPETILVPGADIAPHYYWKGNYLKGDLTTYKWSEQLTVFGNRNPDFYRKLPVILNDRYGLSLSTPLKLLPLLLTFAGILALASRKKASYYSDCQGHSYYKHKILRNMISWAMIVTGLLWTFDNKPFSIGSGFDIYHYAGVVPFQNAIDYIRKEGGSETGVIWSAPEAEMKDKIDGVFLYTAPYLNDIEETHGYNGLAGIYGDVAHAHEPGKTWDKLLLEYCSGVRTVKPVIVGESDYHGRKPIEMIQTVIHSDKTDYSSITSAIINGHSYATVDVNGKGIFIDKAILSNKNQSAGLGEELTVTENGKVTLEINGHMKFEDENIKTDGKLIVVQNGKLLSEHPIDSEIFSFHQDIILTANDLKKQYVRFYIFANNVWLLSNPIFIKTRR